MSKRQLEEKILGQTSQDFITVKKTALDLHRVSENSFLKATFDFVFEILNEQIAPKSLKKNSSLKKRKSMSSLESVVKREVWTFN